MTQHVPYWASRLKGMMRDVPTSEWALRVGTTRQSVRRVTIGEQIPSNDLLKAWARQARVALPEEKRLLQSINESRAERHPVLRDVEELDGLISRSDDMESAFDDDQVVEEITNFVSDLLGVDDDLVDAVNMRVRAILRSARRTP